ncbi:MFS transporter [Brevibacillus agri]|uniref:MDR family MFS transporter n=1 Tax=Brevibacillus TaxID=55080 RepID=UPI00040AA865|nr:MULTISPECIES: MFS transporter [Brevibacillus]MDN4094118.1 MFS transporter [Brevibacillus agri]MDR9506565.1 MFS transporter [Brevibacillus agri]QHZ55727.1 MFS transporter [Brevibacillus sp. NSP2.1]WHX29138.1 MFS transporter [Brevibacillus agri]
MSWIKSRMQEYHPIVWSLVVGTVFVRAASSMSMPFLFLYLSNQTDMDLAMIGLTIGAGPLAGTIGGFIAGTLSDRIGRRRVMLGALYVWTLVFVGFALSKNPLILLLLNMAGGLCRSFYEPVSQALMADVTPPEKRFRVFGLRYTAINVGVAVGPIAGAVLAKTSVALPFLITALIYLVYVISLQGLLNKFGIKQIEGQKKETVTFGRAFSVIVHDKAFRYYMVAGVLGAIGYSQMSSTLAKFTEMTVASGAELFALLMSVNAVVVVLMQMPLTRWAEKKTPLTAIVVGNVMYALGDVGFAYANSWIVFIIGMVLFTFGEILTFTAGDVLIDRMAPEGMRGSYYGAKSFSNLGQFIGPWMGGLLLGLYGGTTLFLTVAAFSMVSSAFQWAGQRVYFATHGKSLNQSRAESL